MKFDLHVHTTLSSCSQLTLEQVLNNAQAKGLDGVCITDHDTMAAADLIKEGVQENGLCVLIGMEYTTKGGDFLLFGPFEHLPLGLPAEIVLATVEAAGGVAVAAHPLRPGRSIDISLLEKGLCQIIEGVNGRNTPEANKEVASWPERYQVGVVGGSDAHTLYELGQVPTEFNVPIQSRADLIRALREGMYNSMVWEEFSQSPQAHQAIPATPLPQNE
ncbi:MAG: PHP domain-containing protein [Candidatus Electrothrix sp. GW3-4]|uniref:PHP domain-containing protein n=1 Tax=Candidatus Electrothrix sp. GW3-4 TaxID=3126740 RepID=UPI0030CE1CAA